MIYLVFLKKKYSLKGIGVLITNGTNLDLPLHQVAKIGHLTIERLCTKW